MEKNLKIFIFIFKYFNVLKSIHLKIRILKFYVLYLITDENIIAKSDWVRYPLQKNSERFLNWRIRTRWALFCAERKNSWCSFAISQLLSLRDKVFYIHCFEEKNTRTNIGRKRRVSYTFIRTTQTHKLKEATNLHKFKY